MICCVILGRYVFFVLGAFLSLGRFAFFFLWSIWVLLGRRLYFFCFLGSPWVGVFFYLGAFGSSGEVCGPLLLAFLGSF